MASGVGAPIGYVVLGSDELADGGAHVEIYTDREDAETERAELTEEAADDERPVDYQVYALVLVPMAIEDSSRFR